MRKLAALVAAAAVCGAGGTALADGDKRKQDNTATAVIEQDAGRAFDFAWAIDRVKRGRDVDHTNMARAFARCTGCRSTAIAFQIVLVSGRPGRLVPRNVAAAVNDGCVECVTYAGARQFVRVTSEPVRFTEEGSAELADVRRDLRAIESQDLTLDEQVAVVEAQEARVNRVLTQELVAADSDDDEEDDNGYRRLDREDSQDDDG